MTILSALYRNVYKKSAKGEKLNFQEFALRRYYENNSKILSVVDEKDWEESKKDLEDLLELCEEKPGFLNTVKEKIKKFKETCPVTCKVIKYASVVGVVGSLVLTAYYNTLNKDKEIPDNINLLELHPEITPFIFNNTDLFTRIDNSTIDLIDINPIFIDQEFISDPFFFFDPEHREMPTWIYDENNQHSFPKLTLIEKIYLNISDMLEPFPSEVALYRNHEDNPPYIGIEKLPILDTDKFNKLDKNNNTVIKINIPFKEGYSPGGLEKELIEEIITNLDGSNADYQLFIADGFGNKNAVVNCSNLNELEIHYNNDSNSVTIYIKETESSFPKSYQQLNDKMKVVPNTKDILEFNNLEHISTEEIEEILIDSQPKKYWDLPNERVNNDAAEYVINFLDFKNNFIDSSFDNKDFDSWLESNNYQHLATNGSLKEVLELLAKYSTQEYEYKKSGDNKFICEDYTLNYINAFDYLRDKNSNLKSTATFYQSSPVRDHAFVGIVSSDGENLYYSFVDPTWADKGSNTDYKDFDALDKAHFK